MWLIHSNNDGRPVIRGWASTEQAAQEAIWKMSADEGVASEEAFFLTQTSAEELAELQRAGLVSRMPARA